ncbi:TetR family transcriptional regulator [Gordonia neofelifaecis]|uniref:Transcriptional regulator, TetR family protein n=1 Tax=Gordonia neofelifaecis NRRL B-59395 TaxID=644548 RepID=F1YPB1_9ACTN|nr:TetR family transcriptional regulator [Gordonia neofelifaecis]EGD53431.1 transcriptional regulator, TetR family protein [Gordonia neofelifaecis NRRL B-59395]
MSDDAPARTGRRTGDSTTRDEILAAARKLFSQSGFAKSSMRAIATEAGVDVALVSYYFGSKRGLFAAAMAIPGDPVARVTAAIEGPRDQLGTRLITAFTTLWESDDAGPALHTMLRSAANDEGAAKAFGGFASDEMMPILSETVGLSEETVRAVASCIFGLALMRYLVGAPAFTSMTTQEIIDDFGPRIQAIIDL